jgi:hypothetical protein
MIKINYKSAPRANKNKQMEKKLNAELLADNADQIIEKDYVMPISDEEISQTKDKVVENAIQLSKLEQEKKEAIAGFKSLIKPIKEENSILLGELKYKVKDYFGKVFVMVDQQEALVGEYTQRGELISTRPIRPSERQMTIHSSTGTND